MTRKQGLTAREIANAKPRASDYWLTDIDTARGVGRLCLRVKRAGSKTFYFRYSDGNGRRVLLPIGPFAEDGDGRARYTLAQARDKAAELAALHRAPDTRDVRAALLAEQEAKQRAELEAQQAAAAEAHKAEQARDFTLRKLCELYIERLTKAGKQSARNAESVFRCHLYAWPLADKPANAVTPRDVTELLRKLTEAGKGRTAAKLRAFMAAAYALALRAELAADAPTALLGFDLNSNPVAPTDALTRYTVALERVLSVDELAAYWRRAKAWPGLTGDALRLHMLTGGQRLAQLLRVTLADFEGDSLTLRDSKGNRSAPRLHVVPLVGEALEIVQRLASERAALGWELLFTSDGKAATRPETLIAALAEILEDERAALKETLAAAGLSEEAAEKRAAKIDYTLRDVRRTVETMLAGNGVSRDTRAHLQSHGLGGIQQRHYDKHDYLAEKRAALALWQRLLGEVARGTYQAGKVRRLRVAA